jgi:uncharacterized protein YecT (DUF1311 family)
MKANVALVGLWAMLFVAACSRGTGSADDTPAAAEPPQVAAEETPAPAQPATPCDDAIDQGSMTACWGTESRKEEERVDAALKKLDVLFASKELSATARQHLQDDQRRWREFVEGHCGLYGELFEGGSAAPMTVAICRWDLAQTRMQQLNGLTDELSR